MYKVATLKINRPNQVWVSDITYVGTQKNPFYLTLITDAYAKKIVGYNISDSLSMIGSIKALRLALKEERDDGLELIHHSDRGLQYCSNVYQKILTAKEILTSMTEKYNPYENAVAERINGILKQEFNIAQKGLSIKDKHKQIRENIAIYNEERPHLSNHKFTPNQMHQQSDIKMKTYKSKNLRENVFSEI